MLGSVWICWPNMGEKLTSNWICYWWFEKNFWGQRFVSKFDMFRLYFLIRQNKYFCLRLPDPPKFLGKIKIRVGKIFMGLKMFVAAAKSCVSKRFLAFQGSLLQQNTSRMGPKHHNSKLYWFVRGIIVGRSQCLLATENSDSTSKKKKKEKKSPLLKIFDHVTLNKHIIFFGPILLTNARYQKW